MSLIKKFKKISKKKYFLQLFNLKFNKKNLKQFTVAYACFYNILSLKSIND